jgi:hypothetical protein
MCDSGGITRGKTLRRVNSSGLDFDTQIEFLSGNISIANDVLEPPIEETDISDSNNEEDEEYKKAKSQPLKIEECVKVNKILCDMFGLNAIKLVSEEMLSTNLSCKDLAVQALS